MSLSRAIELARAARDRAYPKPTVGAVLVRDGEVVGEGATEAAGRHAEIVALEAAGERAHGATMYVTLEPCAHFGTTPPCADAIVAAGVARVVFGARDPNPEAAGGEERLRAAGLEVEHADSWEARALNEAWRTWVSLQRPFVIYKAAMTLDGSLTVPGERWVSGEESRRLVHELRAQVDAVAVGGGTARAARSPTSCTRSPARASSRSSSRAAPRSRRPSSTPTLSTSCSSSSPRRSRAKARASLLRYPPRARCRSSRRGRSAQTCSSRRMSSTPDSQRSDDQLVTHLSHWLTRQLGNDELRRMVEEIGTDELPPGGRDAVNELLVELSTAVPGERAQLEVLVRETVETLVYGD